VTTKVITEAKLLYEEAVMSWSSIYRSITKKLKTYWLLNIKWDQISNDGAVIFTDY
jgi:hypothetical protein